MSSKSIKIKKVVAASLGACSLVGISSVKVEAMFRRPVQGGASGGVRVLGTRVVSGEAKRTYHIDRFKPVGGNVVPQMFQLLDLDKAMDGHFGNVPTKKKPFKVDNSNKPLNISVFSHGDSEGSVHIYTEDFWGGQHRVYESSNGEMRPLLGRGNVENLMNLGIRFVKAYDTLGRDVDVYIVDGETPTNPYYVFEVFTGLYREARKDGQGKIHLGHQVDPKDLPLTVKDRFKVLNDKINENVEPVLGPIIPSKMIPYSDIE